MFATNPFPSKRISVNAALALAILLSGNLQSQDSAIAFEQSDLHVTLKPSQLVSFSVSDDDDDDEKARDRKKMSKGKHRKNAKPSLDHQKSPKNQRRPNDAHPPLPNRAHHEQPSFAPVHPEVLELLGSIHRSLKSIESMMREENERDRKGSDQAFQLMNRMPPTFGPQMFGQQPGHEQANRERINEGVRAPRNFVPRNATPPHAGPRNDGPRRDGPRFDG